MDLSDHGTNEEFLDYTVERIEDEEIIDKDNIDNNFSYSFTGNMICDTCEREFKTFYQYQQHMSEHKVCGIDGCTFTAHEKIIEKHIEMQHCSGLYNQICSVVTPDDIAKWIAERKKKYPNRENVEKRYKQQEEMLKRGEKLEKSKKRFDKHNKTRFTLKQKTLNNPHLRNNKKRTMNKKPPLKGPKPNIRPVSLIDDKSEWNGTLCPFKGTAQLYTEECVDVEEEFDDTEWTEGPSGCTTVTLNNALGSLINSYNSETDSEVESGIKRESVCGTSTNSNLPTKTESQSLSFKSEREISDDEPPIEQKVERTDVSLLISGNSKVNQCKINPQTISKRKRKKRTRNNKAKKSKLETETTAVTSNCNITNQSVTNATVPSEFNKHLYKKRKVSLLERLLANEIRHERNVLLQCVKHVISNNFFDS